METTFIYNGKEITTPNLEKKLKRMKISINDIEIIEKKKTKPVIEDEEINEDKEYVYLSSPIDKIKRVCIVPKGTRPDPVIFLKRFIDNNIYTLDFVKTLKYDN